MIEKKTTKEIVKGSVVSVKSNENNSITDYHLINTYKVWISEDSLIEIINDLIFCSLRLNKSYALFDDELKKETRKLNKEEPTTLTTEYLRYLRKELEKVQEK